MSFGLRSERKLTQNEVKQMAKWSKAQHVKYAATLKRKAAQQECVASAMPPEQQGVKVDPQHIPTPKPTFEYLEPPSLEEKFTQLIRSVRLRAIDQCVEAVLEAIHKLR